MSTFKGSPIPAPTEYYQPDYPMTDWFNQSSYNHALPTAEAFGPGESIQQDYPTLDWYQQSSLTPDDNANEAIEDPTDHAYQVDPMSSVNDTTDAPIDDDAIEALDPTDRLREAMSEILSTPNQPQTARDWNNNLTIIDDDADPPAYSEKEGISSDLAAEAETAEAAGVETAGAGAVEMAGPFAAAWAVGKAIGGTITDVETQSSQNALTQQTLLNRQVPFMAGAETVNNVAAWNQNQIQNTKLAGDVGSNFGILGQVIGHAIGSLSEQQIPQSLLNTAWSAQGKIDPLSDNVNVTNTSASISPNEMTNGEQTSETSNAIDTTPV